MSASIKIMYTTERAAMLSSVLRKMAIASRDSARLDSDMLCLREPLDGERGAVLNQSSAAALQIMWAPLCVVAINAACCRAKPSNIPDCLPLYPGPHSSSF